VPGQPRAQRNERPKNQPERLLDAAEDLFGGRDPDDVSTREITAAAGCNPAAINYHFGSKDGLLDAVLARRLGDLAAEREDEMACLTARAAPPTVRELVEVVAMPLVRLVERDPQHGPAWVRLIARLWLTRRTLVTRRAAHSFDPAPLRDLAQRALADLPVVDARLRWELAMDTLLLALGDPFGAQGGIVFADRARVAIEVATAGLEAPADRPVVAAPRKS
jgi:AcrR family transcriptional regulator